MGTSLSQSDSSSSWGETLAGVIPFVQFGLTFNVGMLLLRASGSEQTSPLLVNLTSLLFLAGFLLIPVGGLGAGWVKGFPRWSYPYAGFAIIISVYLSQASTPGVTLFGYPLFGREPWGARACIPGVLMVLLAVLVTRSFRSIGRFFMHGFQDWTCFTFGLFGLMPLVNFISFDEIRDSYELPFQAALMAITSLTAIAYLRSRTQRGRVLSLFTGTLITVSIDVIGPALYWQDIGSVDAGGMIVQALIFTLFILSPAMLELVRHFAKPAPGQDLTGTG
jgi:hypothetical protein